MGITRARRHLALSWAAERETRGRTSRRQPSRFLADLRPRSPRVAAHAVTELPGAPLRAIPVRAGSDEDPLMAALRAWRATRARDDAVPAYVVAHDSTLAAIAEARPLSAAALRRVKGIGPAKVDAYGDDILAIVAATGGQRSPDR